MIKKHILIFLIIIVALLSSCHSSSIIKRRYQKGYYNSTKKQENNLVANTDNKKLFFMSENSSEKTEKIHSINDSVIKKTVLGDSIITIKKIGEKPIVQKFKTNSNHNISITKDYTRKAIYNERYKKNSLLAMAVCIIPGLGAAVCITAWVNRRKLRMKYDEHELIKENKSELIIASFISYLSVLAILALVVAFFVALSNIS